MSETGKSLHAILGADDGASAEALRKAYLALAVKYHPDRNPGNREAEERFKEISQAYAILSDPAARARYERTRPRKTASTGTASGGQRAAGQQQPGQQSTGPRPSAGGASGGAGASGDSSSGAAGADSSARPGETPDFDEVLANFFKTAKGRETLRDLEGELNKSGIKFTVDDFAQWLKKGPAPDGGAASPGGRATASPEARPGSPERQGSLWS
ncbi:MAG: J domain-containing protein, partial [Candidatus Adiutrix sp.]|nr:J domain-containing protein [Candidatus Adiutrix sp.]